MAPIKIERIISVSSEDEVHPAINLLKIDYSNKKWKCKTPGEQQISIVLQLAQFCKIVSIDVGNENSAFIEVLVGKSCLPNEDFKVLLLTSSLMSLQEAKIGTNVNGVTFFKEESLCKPICEEKWDRIKIVCTQPFNKHSQYGLSFIVFHTESSQNTTIPGVPLKPVASVEPLLKAGGLFACRNKLSNTTTGPAIIRSASHSTDLKIVFKGNSLYKNDAVSSTSSSQVFEESEGKRKNETDSPKDKESRKRKNPVNGKVGGKNGVASCSTTKKKVSPVKAFKKREERPFNSLMTGVVFVISGIENPLRSELRNKAMAMGARYEANWNCNCTHLICAFRNTPKYNQVRGQGKIVKKDWIQECYSRRVRLPWRRFGLDSNDAAAPESEEEIYEEIVNPLPPKGSTCKDSSEDDDDTDDEIEKVRQKQKKHSGNNEAGPSAVRANGIAVVRKIDSNDSAGSSSEIERPKVKDPTEESTSNEVNDSVKQFAAEKIKKETTKNGGTSIYDMDTESEDETYWVKTKLQENSLPPLPAFFKGATIALLDDLSKSDRALLTRYIRAHQGTTANDSTDLNTILYAITENSSAIDRIREDFPQVIGVTADWIWRSHDEGKLLPASPFKINLNN